ncbi:MIP/aquaporin family protein [Leptospira sp. GIMC2001]|uniref:MIP/aquaporin family protein n=1 Tax=Leptospira sp. GIMC2001 TaxID=1513297 RepID=UPI00234B0A83|nr:MIP/aquaporin family protein [Leptospira sp. GIMC2001]WCL48939.1 aquaporin family protein [Leptospira sp. GIMC2001]
MNPFLSAELGEFVGTLVLILLGNGVVAGCLLEKSKSKNGGWIVITAGWAFGVIFGVFSAKLFGSNDAHLNPAVSIGYAIFSSDYSKLITYIPSQIAGAFVGANLVYLQYLPHWKEKNDPGAILAIFSTEPAINHSFSNLISEFIGTFILIIGIYGIYNASIPDLNPHFGTFLVGLLVWAIGLSLGGTTGYAINPARDLGPRIAHSFLPIPGKGSSRWTYSWIPILAPILGAISAGILILSLKL